MIKRVIKYFISTWRSNFLNFNTDTFFQRTGPFLFFEVFEVFRPVCSAFIALCLQLATFFIT